MRSIVVWLIGILLLPGWMGHLYAQMPEPTPTVTLDMRQVPLLDILMELEKQTGLFFSVRVFSAERAARGFPVCPG